MYQINVFASREGIIICVMQLVPGSDLGSGTLPREPHHGALLAVPRHPFRVRLILTLGAARLALIYSPQF